jgi:hypothetical protein
MELGLFIYWLLKARCLACDDIDVYGIYWLRLMFDCI